jgi:hypothetical protein
LKRTRSIVGLTVVQILVGFWAIAGGLGLILDPSGTKMGLPQDYLADSPFDDYLIPGIVLFAVNGLGSVVGALVSLSRKRFAGDLGMVLGSFLVIWILVQLYWVAWFHWLHAVFLGLGILELGLGILVRKAARIRERPAEVGR